MDKFGERINEARKAREWSILELALTADVSSSNIVRYEQGLGGPTLHNAIKLADALDVSLDWLAGRTEE